MKVYRQSIWKAWTNIFFIEMIILGLFFSLISIGSTYQNGLIGSILCLILIFGLIFSYQNFYISLSSDNIIFKNIIYYFLNKKFYFSEIKKIELGYVRTPQKFMRIITINNKSVRYPIDLVNENDLPMIINDLRKNGVNVEVIGEYFKQKGIK